MSGETSFTHFDVYCERSGDPALWAEPLNAVTNLAFLIVAWFAWKDSRTLSGFAVKQHLDIWLLIIAMAAIGIGSGLWHTHVAVWTLLADVIPITLFINVYLLSLYRRIFALPWLKVIAIWAAFQAANVCAEIFLPRDMLNGSVMYLPAWSMLLLSILILQWKHHAATRHLAVTLGIFTVSLVCRTIDREICADIPIGTHFLWHIFNSIVLYRLLSIVLRDVKSKNAQ